MKLNNEIILKNLKKQNLSISKMLREAGISRTAYYSLLKQESLIPNSVHAISATLGISVEDLLSESPLKKTYRLQALLEQVMLRNPNISRENAWHTLLLLEEDPLTRLDRAITRGRKSIYPKRN